MRRGATGLAAASALALAAAAAAPSERTGRGAMPDTWVFYTRSVGSAGTLGGSFTREAALVRTDASVPGIPRIGSFRRAMAAGEWDRLAALVRSLGPPRPSGVHRPGTPMISLGIMAGGRAEVVHGQAEGALTPAESDVFRQVEETVHEVLGHPHLALEGRAAWGAAEIEPDDELTVDFVVSNPGLGPVPFVHPGSRGSAPSGLAVVLARVGPGGAVVDARDVVFAGAEVSEVVGGRSVPGPAPDLAELAPGRQVALRARTRVRLVPADYRASARIDLEAPPGSDEKSVAGAISFDLPRLAVVRAGEKGGKVR